MKKIILCTLMTVLLLLLVSCGHWDGSNPVGATGGGADGYGAAGNTQTESDGSGGSSIDSRIVGEWYYYKSGVYYYYTFEGDGDLRVVADNGDDILGEFTGTYSANGSTMIMRISGRSQNDTLSYQLQNGKLYLTDVTGYTVTLTRL